MCFFCNNLSGEIFTLYTQAAHHCVKQDITDGIVLCFVHLLKCIFVSTCHLLARFICSTLNLY